MLPTLIGVLLLASTALGSTAAASYAKTRVRAFDEKSQQFDIERSGATAGDASGNLALSDGKRVGRNLCYNRFRYYDPAAGRYISPDPIGLVGGSKIFLYARNTTGWVDPYGLTGKCPTEATKVTKKGIARIERHLTRTPGLDAGPAEFKMLERLKAGERTPTDLRFYQHELIESRILAKTRKLHADPVDAVREAHHRTLVKQGLYRAGYETELYHPAAAALFEQ